ncbi:MAG: 16S rRNA (guanine(527)-N(7))-methyltransferase RsmG [Betaproteobacteria bacterium]
MSERPFEVSLRHGLGVLGLDLSDRQVAQLLDYQDLLQKWNRVYNLTAVRDPKDMLTHHLLDSLAVVAPLQRRLQLRHPASGAKILDVGSGAGLPGVVLAICCPQVQLTCVDAVAKKVAFIRQAQVALGLSRLQALHARVETLEGAYDVICSRAFASLLDFVNGTRQVQGPGACWLAMKGQPPADEFAALPPDVRVFHVEQLQVPGLEAQRCIVWMEAVATC